MDDTPPGVTADPKKFAMVPETVLYDKRLTSDAVRIYGVLDRLADKATGECFASRTLLAERARMSKSRVTRATEALSDHGHITKTFVGLGLANEYVLLWRRNRAADARSGAQADARSSANLENAIQSHVNENTDAPTSTTPAAAVEGVERLHAVEVNALVDVLRLHFPDGSVRPLRRFAREAVDRLASELGDDDVADGVKAVVTYLTERHRRVVLGGVPLDGPGYVLNVTGTVIHVRASMGYWRWVDDREESA